MGGRTMPVECEHGVIADWGDFGPDPDDGQVGVHPCIARVNAEEARERREALDELAAESWRLGLER